MSAWQILIVIVVALIALGLFELWVRWRISRAVAKLVIRAKERENNPPAKLDPESLHVVRLTDSAVIHERPGGEVEQVEWSDLNKVEVLTTDEGPFAPDVFWVLHGSKTGCVIPQGTTGDAELLKRLQALPGFRNEAVIDAMSSTSNRRILCWEKKASA